MDIPIYDPREDYDDIPVRKTRPQALEHDDRNRHPDRNTPIQKEIERDDRSPILNFEFKG